MCYWIISLCVLSVWLEVSNSGPLVRQFNGQNMKQNSKMKYSKIRLEPIDSVNKTRIELKFNAFDHYFDIIINENLKLSAMSLTKIVFHDKFGGSNEISWDPQYSGYLVDEPHSTYVLASFPNDLFQGTILTKDFKYIIERIEDENVYYNNDDSNAIIYKIPLDDVDSKDFYDEAQLENEPVTSLHVKDLFSLDRPIHSSLCKLKFVVDAYPFDRVNKKDLMVLLTEILNRVKIADSIFGSSDFDGDGMTDGIGFSVAGIEIYEADRLIHFGNQSLTGTEFFENAQFVSKFEDVCAGIIFTYRPVNNFEQLNSSDQKYSVGGICNGDSNAAIVPLISSVDGSKLPFVTSTLFMTHLLGHLFGSPHDEDFIDKECFAQNQSSDGKHIMALQILSGNSINNYQFSQCSLRSIGHYIKENAGCLTPCDGSQCDDFTPITGPPPTWSSVQLYLTSEYPEYLSTPDFDGDELYEELDEEESAAEQSHQQAVNGTSKRHQNIVYETSSRLLTSPSVASSSCPSKLSFPSFAQYCRIEKSSTRLPMTETNQVLLMLDKSVFEPIAIFALFLTTGLIYRAFYS